MQEQIDQGLQLCEACDHFGLLAFCGHCGRRYHGHGAERRQCAECKIEVTTEYCPRCGEQIVSEYLRRWERGEVDLSAEGRRAKGILDKMIAASPRLAVYLYPSRPDLHPPGTSADLVAAINRGFGQVR